MDKGRYQIYIRAWRERFRQEREDLAAAQVQAGERARACAERLVEKFGAERVCLIGSLARGEGFHLGSDIDLAVAGLAPERYLPALVEIRELAGREVDLITLEEAAPDMVAHVSAEGILLHGRTEVPAPQSRHRSRAKADRSAGG